MGHSILTQSGTSFQQPKQRFSLIEKQKECNISNPFLFWNDIVDYYFLRLCRQSCQVLSAWCFLKLKVGTFKLS